MESFKPVDDRRILNEVEAAAEVTGQSPSSRICGFNQAWLLWKGNIHIDTVFPSSSSFKVSSSRHKVFHIMNWFLQVCGCLPGAAIAGCSLERRETCLTHNSRGRPEFLHWPGQQEVSPKSSIDTMMTRQMETLNKLSNSLNALFTIILNKYLDQGQI